MKKVTGIGGVFFKCKDPEKVKDWYKNHLGFNTDEYGCMFECRGVLSLMILPILTHHKRNS